MTAPAALLRTEKTARVGSDPFIPDSPVREEPRYRPDIDGLRSIAVGLVVLGHTGLLFTGGFIGVDVFFVISGYLITRLILSGYATGTLTLKQFWLRRIRRLPAGPSPAGGAKLLNGMFLARPRGLAALAQTPGVPQLGYANVYYWLQG